MFGLGKEALSIIFPYILIIRVRIISICCCSKGETIYTYCYGKQTGKVKVKERKSEITERMLGNHTPRRLEGAKVLILDNDLCGGSFHVDYRSQGKYWIDVLIPNSEDNWIDIDEMRTSDVKDESLKQNSSILWRM